MKTFDIPQYYKSAITGKIKSLRKVQDPRKKDFSPFRLDLGSVCFYIPRHFGFCYGVENAVEIAYRTLENHPDKRIFFVSEMIHNPNVNADLRSRGVRFILDTAGTPLMDWETLTPDDIVLVPAFGTTVEVERRLRELGVDTQTYDTTCPFVEKVWKTSTKLGNSDYTVIIHGKPHHEETRATFSHSKEAAHSLVIRNMEEAEKLAQVILEKEDKSYFYHHFAGRFSPDFNPDKHLRRIGVVNQTTMLAEKTLAIAEFLKQTVMEKYGEAEVKNHFADTRHTLCYATGENQKATVELLKENADAALVIGGYNSSNTTHIAMLCKQILPTYFISDAKKILSHDEILHFDFEETRQEQKTAFLPSKTPLKLLVTSGASCPDSMVDEVLQRILSFYPDTLEPKEVLKEIAGE